MSVSKHLLTRRPILDADTWFFIGIGAIRIKINGVIMDPDDFTEFYFSERFPKYLLQYGENEILELLFDDPEYTVEVDYGNTRRKR